MGSAPNAWPALRSSDQIVWQRSWRALCRMRASQGEIRYSSRMERMAQAPSRTRILKVPLDAASEERELEFELDFLLSLTIEQRFELLFERSRQMAESLEAHGHRAPSSILKRV